MGLSEVECGVVRVREVGNCMETKEEKKICVVCSREKSTLTDEGLCFACLSKQCESEDDDKGTWFSKG